MNDPASKSRLASILGLLIAARTAWRTLRGRERPVDPSLASGATGPSIENIDPSQRAVPANRRAETIVAGLLLLAAVCGFAFLVFYIVLET
ncbi:MAG TPA: hypothetical protein VHW04_21085, partial [Solirubrobacteraceae bacterium]|nr:hypothetical protein [Solirubrobacteraceae bacterium]